MSELYSVLLLVDYIFKILILCIFITQNLKPSPMASETCWNVDLSRNRNKETRNLNTTCRCAPIIRLPRTHNWAIATVFTLFLFLNISVSFGIDLISISQSLFRNQRLVSSGEIFELGFFRPGKSTNYYIGIWYKKVQVQTVVWVANRDRPISDPYSAELRIVDGNLVLLDESKTQIWSTNVNSTGTSNSTTAVLLDDGNLVLRDVTISAIPIWQSFDYPTHTFLPGSKLGYNKGTGKKQVITSWKSLEDPGPGRFSLELDANASQFLIRWNETKTYWTSGSWKGETFGSVPEMRLNYIYNYSYISNENESYFTYSLYDSLIISRLIMDVSGQIKQLIWLPEIQQWNLFWSQPRQQCQVYGFCGPFSICNNNSLPFCHCLSGFEPKSLSDWNKSDYTGGCVRIVDLQCGNNGRSKGRKPRGLASSEFLWYPPSQKVPVWTTVECESMCLLNCSCSAYAYDYNSDNEITDCRLWYGDLLNLQQSLSNGTITYIKHAASDDPSKSDKKIPGIISGIVILVVILCCGIGYATCKRAKRKQERKKVAARVTKSLIGRKKLVKDESEGIDVPNFDLKEVLAATNDFSHANKLGEGGFGPVYKGELPGGVEVAVKRLSVHSRQGLEEFKNEVVLIAKLQHRNLVKILGYCTEGDEKILIYEYMPNKSLDTFIFDQTRSLDWVMRFNIIWGIIRGLLYLHHDSRVRIIHRDLKTTNILLDGEMNPKISDFGLARIVGGRETEANTDRVVGTYGYMSPEYALDGHFSIKSDVYSFGIVMLEIISGKKNTSFYQYEEALTFLGYAWNQWNEKKPLDLMDQTIIESCDTNEVLKCILVGLLCVQENPEDRPTMLKVVSMLISDIGSIPKPNQPAFVMRSRFPGKLNTETSNQLTMSIIQDGR